MNISHSGYLAICSIVDTVQQKITPNSDVVWCGYETPEDFIIHLNICLDKIKQNDITGLEELNYLFGPTAPIQEHSLSNGWGDEYIVISSKFDKIYNNITFKQKKERVISRIKNYVNSFIQK